MRGTPKGLFLPELVDRKVRPWKKRIVDIREASVDLKHAEANVPEAYTPAQRLARLHELAHVKWSPTNWPKIAANVAGVVGEGADLTACMKISKMLEENRIDWLLWDRRGIDLRPAREVLDWAQMPDPGSLLQAAGMVMQLAWTVWASRGLGKGIPNEPPARVPDPATGEYFDKAWKIVTDESHELAVAIIRGCLRMYHDPRPKTRNAVAAELAAFFKREPEPEEMPPEKAEEKAAQAEAKEAIEKAEAKEEEEESGMGADPHQVGQVIYHDHTTAIRRQNTRIVRRMIPVGQGIHLRFAHRYLIDKAVFGERRLTEGGIMIDGSGSMHWSDKDMQELVERLPAVTVGIYSGSDTVRAGSGIVIGKICTIAKGGRFAKFTGLDPGSDGGNAVDFEALSLLARWPSPRLWLSDGYVCGGRYSGLLCEHPHHHTVSWYRVYGRLHEMCDLLMRQHNILRVPDRETMSKLLKREPVTLYKSSIPAPDSRNFSAIDWPSDIRAQPTRFQL
jgi:hypothetical protein